MSVRRAKRRDRKTGTVVEFLLVDVDFQHANGRRERVRKVSPVQTRRERRSLNGSSARLFSAARSGGRRGHRR